jgi:hypothetical protein
MMKFYCDLIGEKFLCDTLSAVVLDVLGLPANSLEVDPEKVGEGDIETNVMVVCVCVCVCVCVYVCYFALYD